MNRQDPIPHLRIPKSVKPYLKQLADILIEHGQLKNFRAHVDYPYNKRQKVARLIIIITTELEELIDNLNLALNEMSTLPNNRKYTPGEQLKRFRSFFRFYFYEFGRSEDIYLQFLDVLGSWKILNNQEMREFRSAYHKFHGPVILVRNRLIHSLADLTGPWDELSMLAYLGTKSPKNKFTPKFGKHVKIITKELKQCGKGLSSFFQDTVLKALALFIRKYELDAKNGRENLNPPKDQTSSFA